MSSVKIEQEYIPAALKTIGYTNSIKIADTLQGSIWQAQDVKPGARVAIKVTNKTLHKNKLCIHDGEEYHVMEDVVFEAGILSHLSTNKCPNSIVKFHQFFQSEVNYYLVMEYGGESLFEFVVRAYAMMQVNKLGISEWLKMCKYLFKQMVEAIEYIHSKNVVHFDISLENFLVNDVAVQVFSDKYGNEVMKFCFDEPIQCKLCDFGLASYFRNGKFNTSKYCGKTCYKSPEVIAREKEFDGKANDIWCLGVSLFKLIFACDPWKSARKGDESFDSIMNGKLENELKSWHKDHLVDDDLLKLFNGIFQYEQDRITINDIKMSPWLNG